MAKRVRSALVTAGLLCGLTLSCAHAQEQGLSRDDLRALAYRAAQVGDAGTALAYTQALIETDPTDVTSLLLRAQVMQALGETKTAVDTAKLAWSAAVTDEEKFASARQVAAGLNAGAHYTSAQFWLRRAGQNAPDPQAKAVAKNDYQIVRNRNPLAFQLSFSLAPTSNLNGGTTSEFVNSAFTGRSRLDPQNGAQALSGVERAIGVSGQYRLAASAQSATFLTASAAHKSYVLSDDSQDELDAYAAANPTQRVTRASDFTDNRLSLGLAQTRQISDQNTLLTWSVSGARQWYGGDPLYDAFTASAFVQHPVGDTTRVGGGVTAERQVGHGTRPDAQSVRLSGNVVRTFGANTLTVSAMHGRSSSKAVFADYSETQLGASFGLGAPVLNTNLEFGVTALRRSHDDNQVMPGQSRTDDRVTLSATATFNALEYMGFVPSVTVTHQQTDSNIVNFDSDETGVSFGIRSSF